MVKMSRWSCGLWYLVDLLEDANTLKEHTASIYIAEGDSSFLWNVDTHLQVH
jgi:hypothetical protein